MSKPANQSCVKCRYYQLREKDHTSFAHSDSEFHNITGFCVRYPPVIFTFQERMGSSPGVTEGHWCGEYAPSNPVNITDAATTIARLVLLGDLTAVHALVDKLNEDRE